MITLSYSTINLIYQHPHNYINKVCGIKQPDNEYFKRGKRIHRIIQDHVSGIKKDDRLSHLTLSFPIVETVDFDPKCKIEFKIDNKYSMMGFFDGADHTNGRTLEIKSGKVWSIAQFHKAVQRRIYCLALSNIKENVLITAAGDDSTWNINKPKEFIIPVVPEDKKIALDWIYKGIYRLEHIKQFVDEELEATNGVCVDPYCFWGDQCSFK